MESYYPLVLGLLLYYFCENEKKRKLLKISSRFCFYLACIKRYRSRFISGNFVSYLKQYSHVTGKQYSAVGQRNVATVKQHNNDTTGLSLRCTRGRALV
jgi:hypothetical protein